MNARGDKTAVPTPADYAARVDMAGTDLLETESIHDSLDVERRRLAERLRQTREFLGLSQQDAADAAGLTRLVVSAMETGRRKVESVELQSLARVYGQPVSYFLPNAADELPPEVHFLARAARGLADTDRAELLRFAEFLRSYKAPSARSDGGEGGAAPR